MTHSAHIPYSSPADQPNLLTRRQQRMPYIPIGHPSLPPLSQLLTEKSEGVAAGSTASVVGQAMIPTASMVTSTNKTLPALIAEAVSLSGTSVDAAASAAAAAAVSTVQPVITSQPIEHAQMSMYLTQPLYYGDMLPAAAPVPTGTGDLFPDAMVIGGTGANVTAHNPAFVPSAFPIDSAPMFSSDPVTAAAIPDFIGDEDRRMRQLSVSSNSSDKTYSFVSIPGTNHKKRPRRRYDEIERLYHCNWPGCTKAYGTLNHLNAHVSMQKHGPKRHPSEFKEMRKEWRRQKKEREAAKKAAEEALRQEQHDQHQQHQRQQQQQQQALRAIAPPAFQGFQMPLGSYY